MDILYAVEKLIYKGSHNTQSDIYELKSIKNCIKSIIQTPGQ